ncbi:MAG: hypothetical protein IJ662_12300 [Clostridia bacterium]|nr:hypothetical protein [Clostridia bacterium]
MNTVTATQRREHHRRYRMRRMSLWHKFVLLVGYATLAYGVIRGVVYVLVLLEGIA